MNFDHERMRIHHAVVLLAAVLLGAGCAHYPTTARLERYNPQNGYRFRNLTNTGNSDSLHPAQLCRGRQRRIRRGDFVNCQNQPISGVHSDGGYAEMMIAKASGLAAIPDDLLPTEAAPLLCAGLTTFNGLRNSKARPGELVAIQGVGGLGHLAIQFAQRMGFQSQPLLVAQKRKVSRRSSGRIITSTATLKIRLPHFKPLAEHD